MANGLPSWLRDALPEPLRDAVEPVANAGPRRLILRVGPHAVDVSLAEETPRAFIRAGELSFGYRVDAGADQAAAAALCEQLAAALTAVADPLVEHLRGLAGAPAADESGPAFEFDGREPGHSAILSDRQLGRDLRLAWLAAAPITDVELFLYEAGCEQACRFCVYPSLRERQKTPLGRADARLRALVRRGSRVEDSVAWVARIVEILRPRPHARVVLSGPDCLRHPRIDELLELFADAPAPRLELLGPMTRLADPALARRVAGLAGLANIATSLFSHRAEVHDAIVNRPGAHAAVLRALDNCAELGIRASINTVVMPANIDDIAELLALCHARELGVSLWLYHPETNYDILSESWRALDLPALVVGPDALARMWAAIDPSLLDRLGVHHLPRCWVPAELRERLLRDEQAPHPWQFFRQPPGCRECQERSRCRGITHAAAEVLGLDCVTPIR